MLNLMSSRQKDDRACQLVLVQAMAIAMVVLFGGHAFNSPVALWLHRIVTALLTNSSKRTRLMPVSSVPRSPLPTGHSGDKSAILHNLTGGSPEHG